MKDNKDTYSYKGWLVSDSFIKRVFAVVGHYIVGQVLISIVMAILFGIFLLISFIF